MKLTFPQLGLLIFILALYGFLIADKINLVTADLGRHLKNGELFFTHFQIPDTNLYSYTHPDFPFINHHWASGVIFFLIHKIAGFPGLSLFFISLSLTTFLFFFRIAWKYSSFEVATLTSLIIVPVLATRTEVRPEIFTYFFSGVFLWILWNWRHNYLSPRWLFLLPLLEVFWVNLHIYFFVGIILVLIFLSELLLLTSLPHTVYGSEVKGEAKNKLKKLGIIFALLLSATLLNPRGLDGVLYPLEVSKNYGYRLFENQSVWFIERIVSYPPAFFFKVLFGALLASWVYRILKRRPDFFLTPLLLSVTFSLGAWLVIRNFTLFGYMALPLIAININKFVSHRLEIGEFKVKSSAVLLALIGFLILSIMLVNPQLVQLNRKGIGLEKGVTRAADFFRSQHIQGPIFNNYDIGGYLIYYLYEDYRVFVDNRPEAYPRSFFENVYIPLQENEEKWSQESERFGFNVIFFYRHDLTPWAQTFLINRISDRAWAPVYVDDYAIIFLKREGSNQETIKKYELPKELFSINTGN